MRRLGILLSGRGSNFMAIAKSIEDKRLDADITVVLSNRPEATGMTIARDMGLAAKAFPSKGVDREEYDRWLIDELHKHDVELVCLAGYMRILSGHFIREFPLRILNIHPSLLPAFPGLDAQYQALMHGVKVTGCTAHFVDEGLDSGPIISQVPVAVEDNDTVDTLSKRILRVEHRMYSEAIALVLSQKFRIDGRRVIAE